MSVLAIFMTMTMHRMSYSLSDGDIRLSNNDGNQVGDNPHYGYVEVYYQGSWGTVCDDGVGDSGNEIAQVICNQLGYENVDSVNTCSGSFDLSCKPYGYGSGDILDEVKCVGTESNLLECSHNDWNVHDCDHDEDIGIQCSNDIEPITPAPTAVSRTCSLYTYTGSNYGGTQYGPFDVGDAWWAGPTGQNFPDNSVGSAKLYTHGDYTCTADFYNGGYPCNSLSWTLTTSNPSYPAVMVTSPDVWISCITTYQPTPTSAPRSTPEPTTPAPTTPAPTSAPTYIGCYNDEGPVSAGGGGRAMTDVSFDGTFTGCISACSSYSYYALQNGLSQCFCGNYLSTITRYGVYNGTNWNAYTRSDCYTLGTDIVGGSWTNAIYQYGTAAPTTSAPTTSAQTPTTVGYDAAKGLNTFDALLYSSLLSFLYFFFG